MDPTVTKEIAAWYVTQGVLGVTTFLLLSALIYLYRQLNTQQERHRNELAAKDAAHKVEIAAKDALIEELHDDVLKEARTGFDVARKAETTLDALLQTARRGAA